MQTEKIAQNSADSFVKPLLEKLKSGGPIVWGEVSSKLTEYLNIEIDYYKTTEEKRSRLNSEPGIVIANHPSSIDPCFIFPAIKRADVLVMMQRKRFPFLEKFLGTENILPAPAGAKEFKETLVKIKEHIASGGLFILFPSGGKEMATDEFHFQSGFAEILSEMKPEDMVYSFYIDPKVGAKITSDLVGPPRNSEDAPLLIAPELHVRPATEHLTVPVREEYSTAKEWQEIVSNEENGRAARIQRNDLFTQHYLEQFKAGS